MSPHCPSLTIPRNGVLHPCGSHGPEGTPRLRQGRTFAQFAKEGSAGTQAGEPKSGPSGFLALKTVGVGGRDLGAGPGYVCARKCVPEGAGEQVGVWTVERYLDG